MYSQKQQLEIEKLNTQVENMLQALLHARKKIFLRKLAQYVAAN